MKMNHVNSSNLVSVGYDPASMTLRIQFNDGTYDYYRVPQSVYFSLMSSSSKGKYHDALIKNNYRYNRV